MKQKKTLYNLLTHRYLLSVREEDNLAEKATVSFTYMRLLVLAAVLFIFCFGVSSVVVNSFHSGGAGRGQGSLDRRLVELSMQVDSLAEEVARKERFIQSFQQLVSDRVAPAEAAPTGSSGEGSKADKVNLDELDPVDSMFRKEFEGQEYELTSIRNQPGSLQHLLLFPPISGVVLQKFDGRSRHYGVDVVAQKNEPIKAAADGSVILSSWTQDAGHVIAIQHANQLVSFYKHNSVLLKKVGDIVKAGDIVAIIGNSGEYTDGPHLHFELWHNGNPINPEDFISF